jgi:hypothetical protein
MRALAISIFDSQEQLVATISLVSNRASLVQFSNPVLNDLKATGRPISHRLGWSSWSPCARACFGASTLFEWDEPFYNSASTHEGQLARPDWLATHHSGNHGSPVQLSRQEQTAKLKPTTACVAPLKSCRSRRRPARLVRRFREPQCAHAAPGLRRRLRESRGRPGFARVRSSRRALRSMRWPTG